jgi:hypothetical protein|tara:strand:- start:7665 stop:8255 length:591 start_codon:yes stop_codon:yes gene_type:complete
MKSMRILGSTAFGSEKRQSRDYYATDPQALIDFLEATKTKNDFWKGNNFWEPACGDGNLANVLLENNWNVFQSDIFKYNNRHQVFDFLDCQKPKPKTNIITNPPYKIGQKFIEKALTLIDPGYKAAFLMRIQFLESKGRHEFFQKHPPKFVYIHSSRIKIFKNNDQEKYSDAQPLCYAWFVWEKGFKGETTVRWIK